MGIFGNEFGGLGFGCLVLLALRLPDKRPKSTRMGHISHITCFLFPVGRDLPEFHLICLFREDTIKNQNSQS